jgi:hypothetical protein
MKGRMIPNVDQSAIKRLRWETRIKQSGREMGEERSLTPRQWRMNTSEATTADVQQLRPTAPRPSRPAVHRQPASVYYPLFAKSSH